MSRIGLVYVSFKMLYNFAALLLLEDDAATSFFGTADVNYDQ